MTSFGQDGDAIHISSTVDTLRQVKLKVLPHSTCKKNKWAKIIGLKVTKKMLCAGYGPSDRRGACAGDQGGPLVCRRSSGEWVLQGVMSWGSPNCDTVLSPSVFTRVTEYMEWIYENM